MDSLSSKKRVRVDSDESPDSVEAKRVLLDILDDSVSDSLSHDLDSFIKTFQDEISPAPELGFLLEASDDELGLPPTDTSTRGLAESVELSELWGLDDSFPSYDSFEYEYVYDGSDHNNINSYSYNNGDDVALDGLFDHTDLGFGSTDLT
ncbi:uncharacterized protein LOC143597861 [Bidens hawaiensis]|uniref:uncharacterized protein LOC143597861 n=1 Tax=Bidens hawaiensis TaxID=980011 RepID=UPI00404B00F1